jgi:hypothetical protein
VAAHARLLRLLARRNASLEITPRRWFSRAQRCARACLRGLGARAVDRVPRMSSSGRPASGDPGSGAGINRRATPFRPNPEFLRLARAWYGRLMLTTSPVYLESPNAKLQIAALLRAACTFHLRPRFSVRGDRPATGGDSKFFLRKKPAPRLRSRVRVTGDCAAIPAMRRVRMVA